MGSILGYFPVLHGATICRQEERQHHDKDAKAEARGALHKTGSNAQQEDGYHDTTNHLLFI